MTKTTLELHPLCTLFPRLGDDDLHALAADIAAHGLRHPIVLHDGMVLDGGNRYRACLIAGVEPKFVEFAGGNLASYVISANLHRRHMTPGQMAAIVASAQDWANAHKQGGTGANQHRSEQTGNVAPLLTIADRAAQSGASERTQKMADAVAKADPELAKQVAHGDVSLPKALAKVKGKKDKAPASAKKKAPPSAQPAESEEAGHDLGDDDTAAELLVEMHADIERLTGLIKVAEADDLKAEAIKWRRMYDDAGRKQADAMDAVKRAEKREAWNKKQLMRCGKAVGETDPDKIPAAVEAFVRANGRLAA